MPRLGVNAAVVGGRVVAGDVEVADGEIVGVGLGPAGAGAGIAVPGFVDLQVNGFGGTDFTSTDLDGHRRASVAIARTGVTSYLVTIPTAAPETYAETLAAAGAAVGSDLPGARALGVHLEGPFLAPARRGAHRAEWLRPPDLGLLETLLDSAPIALFTLAPELEGAGGLIDALVRRGIIVAVGHSDGDAATVHAAFDRGARAVTHAWNGQRPPTAREAGVTGVALVREDVMVCVIADLVHVSADVLRLTLRLAGDRLAVVSDAAWPAGLSDGDHRGGDATVTVAGGAVRLPDGTLMGSASGLDAALRNLVSLGLPLPEAVKGVSTRPAQLLGRPDLGTLAPGGRADVAVLDDDLSIRRVYVAGRALD